jgi:hypothetical protein
MKKRSFILTFVVVGLVMAIMLSASPMIVEEPGAQKKSFTEWMRSLPDETRVQVEKVFESNLDCMGNMDEASRPDINSWRESVYRGLEPILTPEELKGFIGIMNGNTGEKLSATTVVKCTNCQAPSSNLNIAYDFLVAAQSDYNSSYCEYGFYPDQVLPLIIAAKTRTGLAKAAAEDAYNNCNCTSAQNALYQAQQARWKVGYAIDNTKRYCDPTPWKFWLVMARDHLDYAISGLNACINEACN